MNEEEIKPLVMPKWPPDVEAAIREELEEYRKRSIIVEKMLGEKENGLDHP